MFFTSLVASDLYTQDKELNGESLIELTSDSKKLQSYTDSISKYLYRDVHISGNAILAGKKIIRANNTIADSILFKFKMMEIYFNLNMKENLEAFNTVRVIESELNWNEISSDSKTWFNYIKGFVCKIFGDLETAQKAYMDNIALGRKNKDKKTLFMNLHALAQLYNDEYEYESAKECLYEIVENKEPNIIRQETLAICYGELSESYSKLGDQKTALKYLKLASKIAKEEKLNVLEAEFLHDAATIYLQENKIGEADKIYKLLGGFSSGANDQSNINDRQKLLCALYKKKKMYAEALSTLFKIIENTDDEDIDSQIKNNIQAHEIYNNLNNHQKAYEHSLAATKLSEQKALDSKKQKTEYLKIKFKSEQRENENMLLSMQVKESQARQKLLFVLIALSGVILISLIWAFLQKSKWNIRLKQEVLKRTSKLKQSNQELREFNKILSHDLKEPIRNIVGFSELADRNIQNPEKLIEHLNYIQTSAHQLNHLIANSIKYRNLDQLDQDVIGPIDLNKMLTEIVQEGQKIYPNKKIKLDIENASTIHTKPKALKQLLQAIVDNSVKFNNQETVKITASYLEQNGEHQIKIKDNGIGIPNMYREKVFKRFSRLNRRERYAGSGLGLSIAKKIIDKANGKISILESKEQMGTTILLTIPC